MKIAILGKWPEGKLFGGVDNHTACLVKSLSKQKGINLHVISFGSLSKHFKEGNAEIVLIKSRKIYYLLPFLALIRLFLEIHKIKPDLIHVQGMTLSPYILLAGLLKNRYPTMVMILGIVSRETKFEDDTNNVWNFLNRLSEKYFALKIQNLVVETLLIKNVVETLTDSKIYVVSSGIENSKIQEIKHIAFGQSSDIFVASRLEKLKGIDILIEAIPAVKKSIPALKVSIAGAGSYEDELKNLVEKLNLKNNVRFVGYIYGDEKYQYYKACKLVVVPTRWDCQPFPIFEAAACGIPVIVSDMANEAFVVDGKTGLKFKSDDAEELSNKILLLLKDDKLREQMGRAAKLRAQKFDWDVTAKNYVLVYKDIISNFITKKHK